MRIFSAPCMFTVAASLATTVTCGQISFNLDTAFRTQIQRQYVNSVIRGSDGKLIISGIMRFPGEFSDYRLVRLLPDGSRDASFMNSGLGGGDYTMAE